MSLKMGPGNCAFLHLTLVPWIPAAGELKTKPTQHSVQKLREIGIMPDALLCRADRPIPDEERAKISLFANVHEFGVISVWDVDTIYKVPRMLHAQGLDELICAKLQLHTKPGQPDALGQAGRRGRAPAARGDDRDVRQVRRALGLVQVAQRGAAPRRHPQPRAGQDRVRRLRGPDARRTSPTSAASTRSWSRAASASAASRARSSRSSTRARRRSPTSASASACRSRRSSTRATRSGLADANSTEFDPDTAHPVIALIDEWQDRDGSIQKRDAQSDLGGTMRLGAQSSDVKPGTLAHEIYGNVVTERHRHRYEANEHYLERLTDAGLVISAITQREKLTEIVELPRTVHPWFIGVQFHPEFKSTPWGGHPLFKSFIHAALAHQAERAEKVAAEAHEALRLRRRARASAVPDRRPVRGRVGAVADGRRRAAQGNHREGSACRSSSSRATTRRTARAAPRFAAPASTRGSRSWPR